MGQVEEVDTNEKRLDGENFFMFELNLICPNRYHGEEF